MAAPSTKAVLADSKAGQLVSQRGSGHASFGAQAGQSGHSGAGAGPSHTGTSGGEGKYPLSRSRRAPSTKSAAQAGNEAARTMSQR